MTLRQVRRRPAFTLIELLVVIGIIILLATLAAAFLPNLDRNKGVPNGVAQLHGWINLGKQHAIRDGAARGVRLIPDPNDPTRVTSLEYIEQPEPVAPRGPGIKVHLRTMEQVYDDVVFPAAPHIGPLTVATLYQDPGNTYQPLPNTTPPQNLWMNWEGVQPGDCFQITGSPSQFASVRRFTAPPLPSPPGLPPAPTMAGKTFSQLVLDRVIEGTELHQVQLMPPVWVGNVIVTANNFRVIRQPRPLVGEPTLQLHKDVYIDLTRSHPCPTFVANPPPAGLGLKRFSNNHQLTSDWAPYVNPDTWLPYLDILFNSSGAVANAPLGQIFLWVQHVDRPNDALLLSIYTRTGKTAPYSVFDVDVTQFDPYSFARTGQSPGL